MLPPLEIILAFTGFSTPAPAFLQSVTGSLHDSFAAADSRPDDSSQVSSCGQSTRVLCALQLGKCSLLARVLVLILALA